ncbi:MAG: hypothetical protein ACI9EB_002034, partial [Pseudomonas sp.]
ARNIGEALGVGTPLQLLQKNGEAFSAAERYSSGVRLRDLDTLETTLRQLQPLRWPEAALGKVDLQRASQGRALFTENCAYCHAINVTPQAQRLAPTRDPEWHLRVLPTREIGTDPTAANHIAEYRFDLRKLNWSKTELGKLNVKLIGNELADVDFVSISSAKGLAYITAYVEQRAYKDAGIGAAEQVRMNGCGLSIGVQEKRGYKACPLKVSGPRHRSCVTVR